MLTEKHFEINEKSSQRGIPDSNRSNFFTNNDRNPWFVAF